jgi:chromosome transmission fidelity protein 4
LTQLHAAFFSSKFCVKQVWNDVGLIIQYNSDDEQSINVEFHDTATHHAIHVNNTLAYNLADLSSSAVLLASEADDNSPRLVLMIDFLGVLGLL